MRKMANSKLLKICFFVLWVGIAIGCIKMKVEAGLQDNAYVTFSPDGKAFTTNADETDTKWYESGYTVYTGKVSSLRAPEKGEHLYTAIRTDQIAVGKWKVMHSRGRCIHDSYPEEHYFHGVNYGTEICLQPYYSGWIAYCADCGKNIVNTFFYMSESAASSLGELDMSMAYYYRCPRCTNLEMGVELKQHSCQAISANQYNVRYHANFGKGYMPKSVHMYNNAGLYEGNIVTPQKNLTLNNYTREGYIFVGWNTKQDGTGQSYADGDEIYNLCEGEQESIVLYAQWEKCRSVLCIDPAGGRYNGSEQIVELPGLFGSSYPLSSGKLEPPVGETVSFDTNGGNAIEPMTSKRTFSEWSFRQPLQGSIENDVYIYSGADGAKDYATAMYKNQGIILPEAVKEGYSFGGWYYDKEGTKLAGTAGDQFLVEMDLTLYAQWVELQLTAKDNYSAYGGAGAVDLNWKQPDEQDKTYLIYQRKEDNQWQKIHGADDVSVEKYIRKEIVYTGAAGSYTIPYSGYYDVTLQGAQGQNNGKYTGGNGGQITARIYFEKGEQLQYEIGGQNGYHGGGIASVYGNGGGYSSVFTEGRELLLIAGGGGGATAYSDGLPGGSSAGVIDSSFGQDGMAGGGGGYRGGSAGKVVIHTHTETCCHVHSGTPNVYGGCYTVPNTCGNREFRKEMYKQTFYYGNIDDNGKHIYCVRCGSHECPGHRDSYYHYICTMCGTAFENIQPNQCTALKRYELGCDRTEEYVCGYDEEQVLQISRAYGGSNYANPEECLNFQEEQGVSEGDGVLVIEAVQIGFREDNSLHAVRAQDCAVPDKIDDSTIEIKPVDESRVHVVFKKPQDYGTVYHHLVESYNKESGCLISTSNQTSNRLTSGIRGYRYCVDEQVDTEMDGEDTFYSCTDEKPYIGLSITEETQYLHIAAEDKAGNISDTVHIPISTREVFFWPVITEQMSVRQEANVHKVQDTSGMGEILAEKGDNAYFVKADGVTPFTVDFAARLLGTAQDTYQINQMHFVLQNPINKLEEGALKLMVPMKTSINAGNYSYKNEEIQKQFSGDFLPELVSFTEVRRSDYCKQLSAVQAFKLGPESDGKVLWMLPRAGVLTESVQILSDPVQDRENGIILIADGQGPMITGLDLPEEITGEAWEYELEIKASDEGSGLKELRLEIRNENNGSCEIITDQDGDGCISLTLSSERALFWGRFTIAVYAKDNVGNESTESYGMDGLSVTADIENTMSPQSNAFKKGESGILHVQTTGYAQCLEILFPEEWINLNPTLNRTYVYSEPAAVKTEELAFMVPLKVPDGEYSVIVRAYKEGKKVEAKPELLTIRVEGNVLDEIRTRLR